MRNNKGFSLVELIVVIAIMAILAAVAVVGVSVYVPKAQQAKDKQLVSDVEQALNLYYQSNAGNMTGGYVIITTSGTTAGGSGVDAMTDMFGSSYIDNKLAYDGWTGAAGMLEVLAGYSQTDLMLISGSSYFNSSTESLMGAVDTVLDMASNVIAGVENEDDRRDYLYLILAPTGCSQEQQETADHVVDTLDNYDLMGNSTAISNMLVGAMADTLGQNTVLTTIINEYATAYAYSQTPNGDDAALKKMQENLNNLSVELLTAGSEYDALDLLYDGFDDPQYKDLYKGYDEYVTKADKEGVLDSDREALETMMGAVKEISGNFEDEISLKEESLYTSAGVMAQVQDYINAVETLAGLSDTERALLQTLPENAIVVFLSVDGAISIYPGTAGSAK